MAAIVVVLSTFMYAIVPRKFTLQCRWQVSSFCSPLMLLDSLVCRVSPQHPDAQVDPAAPVTSTPQAGSECPQNGSNPAGTLDQTASAADGARAEVLGAPAGTAACCADVVVDCPAASGDVLMEIDGAAGYEGEQRLQLILGFFS